MSLRSAALPRWLPELPRRCSPRACTTLMPEQP
jgi:hypothetical protein